MSAGLGRWSGVILAAVFGSCLFQSGLLLAQSPTEIPAETRRLVREIAAAATPKEASGLYTKLLKSTDQGGLRKLKDVPETGVALRAAWEEAVATRDGEQINPQALAKFLGFVEGRLAIDLPDWFEQLIMNARYWPEHGKAVLGMPDAWIMEGPDLPDLVKIERSGESTSVQFEKQSLNAAAEILELRRQTSGNTAGLLEEKDCFLALHSRNADRYPLVCLNRKTGAIRWKSTVWAADNDWIHLGKPYEIVMLHTKDKQLLVIGAGAQHFYIESFDRQTGKSLFRFVNWFTSEVTIKP